MRNISGFTCPKTASCLLLLPLLTGLAACAGSTPEVISACPPAQIAVPADRLGNANDEGELRFVVTMDQLSSSCRHEGDTVLVDLDLALTASPGPALDLEQIPVTYFLATIDPSRQIVDKQVVQTKIELDGGRSATSVREQLTLRLPVSTDESGANYSLYLGFQPDRQPS